MVLLTAVYVLATILLVRQSRRANRIAQQNLESLWKLERERSRPHVVIRFDFSIPFLSLIVENTGLTTARNVRFEMDRMLTIVTGLMSGQPVSFLERPIASLAPSQKLKTILGSWGDAEKTWDGLSFAGTIRYETEEGREINEPFEIELESQKNLLYGGDKGLHQIALALEKIAASMEKRSGYQEAGRMPSFQIPPLPDTFGTENRLR